MQVKDRREILRIGGKQLAKKVLEGKWKPQIECMCSVGTLGGGEASLEKK